MCSITLLRWSHNYFKFFFRSDKMVQWSILHSELVWSLFLAMKFQFDFFPTELFKSWRLRQKWYSKQSSDCKCWLDQKILQSSGDFSSATSHVHLSLYFQFIFSHWFMPLYLSESCYRDWLFACFIDKHIPTRVTILTYNSTWTAQSNESP